MGIYGDIQRGKITIDPAIFQLVDCIGTPTGLAWDAETRMVEHKGKVATRLERGVHIGDDGATVGHILQSEDTDGMIESRVTDREANCRVGHKV